MLTVRGAASPSRRKKPLGDVDQKPDPAKRGDGDGNQIDHLEEALPHALPTSALAIRFNDTRVLKLLSAGGRVIRNRERLLPASEHRVALRRKW